MIPDVAALAARSDVACALARVHESDAETLDDMESAAQIPAPSGQERLRGEWFRDRLQSLGLDADFDSAGNVIARWPRLQSRQEEPAIVLASHLDTVFAADTDLTVVREAGIRRGPGITDNARGLAALLALVRALGTAQWRAGRPVAFVGTVGEEGLGNLRGVRHLLREGAALRRSAAFIAVDGSGRRQIVTRALGSVRLRFDVRGAGGHSWADRHRPNPIRALSSAIVRFRRVTPAGCVVAPTRIGGGESINAIPAHAWVDVDIRARDANQLHSAEQRVRQTVARAVEAENEHVGEGAPLHFDCVRIGDRPIGSAPDHLPIVRIAAAATRWGGEEPEFVAASTDANIPLALGIPAIAMGAGGRSGATHTTGEWYDNEGGPEGIQRLVLTLVALSELDGNGG